MLDHVRLSLFLLQVILKLLCIELSALPFSCLLGLIIIVPFYGFFVGISLSHLLILGGVT